MDNSGWQDFIKIKDNFLTKNQKLNDKDIEIINSQMAKLKKEIAVNEERLLELGRLLDYNDLRKRDFSNAQITEIIQEDNQTILEAQTYLKEQTTQDRDYMFGYPSNMTKESSLISYLRWIESQLYYINSCGSPYSEGNYRMSKRSKELAIINKVMTNLNMNKDEFWGYITTGGTEGNLWGIREGYTKYPEGKLYFSEDTHYSALKGATILPHAKYEVIPSIQGHIDKEKLLKAIFADPNAKKNGVILLLNYGTTTYGSIDDIPAIINELTTKKIPYYLHVDAALYGGIPHNQLASPNEELQHIIALGLDSISISLHKYLGLPKTNGLLLAKTQNNSQFIEYIGQNDVTLCGSRDFLPFTTLQKITEQYERTSPEEYHKNISLFETSLKEAHIPYEKGTPNGNIFVLKKPSDKLCKKYQLATFNYNNSDKAHIIIFPFHKSTIIKELIKDLKEDFKEI